MVNRVNGSMKPLLVLLPAPARWAGLEELLAADSPTWLDDLEARVVHGVEGAQDALAIIPQGSQVLAAAGISRSGPVGILRQVYTRSDHRKRGLARQILQTLLTWFPMTGGRRLHLGCPQALIPFFAKFNFYETQIAEGEGGPAAMMRRAFSTGDEPAGTESAAQPATVRPLTRADWPGMVELLQHEPGGVPAVPLAQSAVTAPATTLDLLNQQARRQVALLGAFSGDEMTGFASLATDQLGERTFAMLTPFGPGPSPLREAVISAAGRLGYKKVDFPLEALPVETT